MGKVLVSASFDDLRSPQVRFLQEAARLGSVHVLLWNDELVVRLTGKEPKFPEAERRYFVEAIRYVDRLSVIDGPAETNALPEEYLEPEAIWAVEQSAHSKAKEDFCRAAGMHCRVIGREQIEGFPEHAADEPEVDSQPDTHAARGRKRKKVIVTGCYDWLHSGHVRFFEEVAELGDLYVVVGHDANVRLLKGEGHPLFSEQERRYMVGAIRHVKQALVSTGRGWLDAEPEIQRIRPDIYAVNEDGDKPEKRAYCESVGIEYRVLIRRPKEGLPRRESTHLRGF